MKLITGAVIPAFNRNSRRKTCMLDQSAAPQSASARVSPYEFTNSDLTRRLDERYREGIEQVDLLMRTENVTSHGKFFSPTTSRRTRATHRRARRSWSPRTSPRSRTSTRAQRALIMVVLMTASAYASIWRLPTPTAPPVTQARQGLLRSTCSSARPEARPEIARPTSSRISKRSCARSRTSARRLDNYATTSRTLQGDHAETLIETGSAWVGSPTEVRDQIEASTILRWLRLRLTQVNFHLFPTPNRCVRSPSSAKKSSAFQRRRRPMKRYSC